MFFVRALIASMVLAFPLAAVCGADQKKPNSLELAEMLGELEKKNIAANPNPVRREEKLDKDGDGYFETHNFYEDGVIAKEELDRNKDGTPDKTTEFLGGKKEKISEDTDFDLQADNWSVFNRGKLRLRQRDTNHDGEPDHFSFYLNGRDLVLREEDRNFDGKIDDRALKVWGDRRVPSGTGSNGVVRYITLPGYITQKKISDDNFDGLIDRYYEKGVPDRDRNKKIGQPFNSELKSADDGF